MFCGLILFSRLSIQWYQIHTPRALFAPPPPEFKCSCNPSFAIPQTRIPTSLKISCSSSSDIIYQIRSQAAVIKRFPRSPVLYHSTPWIVHSSRRNFSRKQEIVASSSHASVHRNCTICKSSRKAASMSWPGLAGDDEPTIRSTAAHHGHMACTERAPLSPLRRDAGSHPRARVQIW